MKNIVLFFVLVITLAGCGRPAYQPEREELIAMETAPIPKKKAVTIVIDPGHGGKDQGAHKKNPSYQEKDLTLSTAKLLAMYLNQMGYNTIVTRDTDTFIPLDARSCFANSNGADLFLSVHYNAAASADAHGVEVFYFKEDKDRDRVVASKSLADAVLGRIITQTNAKSRGVKHGNLAVVRETEMPAILIEGGFLTNSEELKNIQNPQYRSILARGIALGVRDFIKEHNIGKKL